MDNDKNQKKYKGCLFVVVGILVFLFVIVYMLFFQLHTLETSNAPDKSYEIIVKYKDAFSFGPSGVIIYYKKKNDLLKHKLIITSIYNDGGNLSSDNCKIKWNNEVAIITLTGEEQEEEIYSIDFNKNIKVTKLHGQRSYIK